MEVSATQRAGAVVLHIDGDLTTTSSPEAETQMLDLLGSETGKNVVIDVSRVGFIASTGLRIILALGKKLDSDGCKLGVCSLNDTTRSVFEMSGFSRIFPIFETEDEAIAELGAS